MSDDERPETRSTIELMVGQVVTVRKLSGSGAEVFAYPGVIAQTLPAGVRLDAHWTRATMALGYATFEPGDHFIEWFFADRWYNIMEVHGAGEALKGWYCNVTYPAEFTAASVSYRDLALDLWVAPDGATLTLDEDEFAADASITAEAREQAWAALEALRALVAARATPFDTLPG